MDKRTREILPARPERIFRFDEVSCASSSLGLISGVDVMPLVLNFTDRARFGTSRLDPIDTPFRPNSP